MKYRKKPVVIEAYKTDKVEYIKTLEGTMKADIGDYIITGVQGEKYPCKPDIFEETYEQISEARGMLWCKILNMWCDDITDECPLDDDCNGCDEAEDGEQND